MRIIKSLLVYSILTLTVFTTSKAQKLNNKSIIGVWMVKTHVSTSEDTTTTLNFTGKSRAYTFNADETFVLKFFGETSELAMLGQWKLSDSDDKINLYNIEIKISAPPNTETQNHSIKLLDFTGKTFSIMEYHVGDIKPGLSVYRKL
jgi:hypothetical protein